MPPQGLLRTPWMIWLQSCSSSPALSRARAVLSATLAYRIGTRAALGADALQKDAGRFISRVLRDQLAAERLGEHVLVEMVDQFAGAGRFGGKAVDPCKGILHAPNNFLLFIPRWHRDFNQPAV